MSKQNDTKFLYLLVDCRYNDGKRILPAMSCIKWWNWRI